MPILDGHSIEGLLFDADGTLIDTYDIILASMRYTVNELYGGHATDVELMERVGTPLYDQMLLFAGGDEAKATEMVVEYRKHNDSIHDQGVHAFADTQEALACFKEQGFRMGVVTSKRHHMAALGLKLAGIGNYFEFIIGSDDWPEHKPAPGSILHGCDLMGLNPNQCAYIGDSPFDIQAGNAAGCLTVAALWGMFSSEVLHDEHPDMVCTTLGQLAERTSPAFEEVCIL